MDEPKDFDRMQTLYMQNTDTDTEQPTCKMLLFGSCPNDAGDCIGQDKMCQWQ